ncbi:MAG: hypothetical protein RLZZ399_1155 [Verrucomicrobiota bacterium]|jgi:hypothetical protein
MKTFSLVVLLIILDALSSSFGKSEEVWYEKKETSAIPLFSIETSKVIYQGQLVDGLGKKVPYSFEMELRACLYSSLKKDVESGRFPFYGLFYSPEKDLSNNVIVSIVVKVENRELVVPGRALDGIVNPQIPGRLKVEIASDGYVVVDFLGPRGEGGYECAIIFQHWKFEQRQIKGIMNSIDVLR